MLISITTPSSVRKITLIVTYRRAVVIGLTICEHKYPFSDVAQASLTFLVLINRDANLNHYS